MPGADVTALQDYLKSASTQASAAVEACTALDAPTRTRWYDLAGRIVAYVSDDSATLVAGQLLKIELGGFLITLQAKGCGNVAQAVRSAPKESPGGNPPMATKANPLFDVFGSIGSLLPWALAALVVFELKRK